MKYRIVRVPGGYEIEQKILFFWTNLHHGFLCTAPFKSIEGAIDAINKLSKLPEKKIVVKVIDFKSKVAGE